MSIVQVNLQPGYSKALKLRMTSTLRAVVAGITRTAPAAVSVAIRDDVTDKGKSQQAVTSQGRSESTDPATLVQDYLTAMEQRELDRAQSFLAENFVMTFPGSGELTSLSELVAWSASRYRRIGKTLASLNVAYETNKIVVFVHGTLAGEWPDGSPFDGIRFIDRFEIRDNRLERQDVWNDLANTRS